MFYHTELKWMFLTKKKGKQTEKKQQEKISDEQRQKLCLLRVGRNIQMIVHFNSFMALQ